MRFSVHNKDKRNIPIESGGLGERERVNRYGAMHLQAFAKGFGPGGGLRDRCRVREIMAAVYFLLIAKLEVQILHSEAAVRISIIVRCCCRTVVEIVKKTTMQNIERYQRHINSLWEWQMGARVTRKR